MPPGVSVCRCRRFIRIYFSNQNQSALHSLPSQPYHQLHSALFQLDHSAPIRGWLFFNRTERWPPLYLPLPTFENRAPVSSSWNSLHQNFSAALLAVHSSAPRPYDPQRLDQKDSLGSVRKILQSPFMNIPITNSASNAVRHINLCGD